MNIEMIREFFGWCTVINCGLLVISSISVVTLRKLMSRMHQRMFGIDEASVSRAYFQYLANYKIAIIVFNGVPYIALRIME